MIISEDEIASEKFICPVKPLNQLEQLKNEYDIVFICSDFYQELVQVLLQLGWRKEQIRLQDDICRYLSKANIMMYYAEFVYEKYHYKKWEVGKFCSIASGAVFMLG